ncbi:MAG: Type 1 glutamine amidotransferase-like domain-containing protein, partial [Ignavibacteriaceae bacterium]
ASEAYNKKINSRPLADEQSIYDELITASAIFIKGGDQWNYINFWKGTKTEEAIKYVFNHGGVIAGTSAGAAVLGNIDFTAKNGSGNLRTFLKNPFVNSVDLEDNFLNFVPNVLFDTHFIERGRFARLIPMIYNYFSQTSQNILGIGIDDRTAFCIDKNGVGEAMGSGGVAIFQKDDKTFFSDFISGNYTIENLKCDQLIAGWKFDLNSDYISFIPQSANNIDTSTSYQFPATDFYLTGTNQISGQLSSNLNDFLSNFNSQSVLVLSYTGYSSQAAIVTDYLNTNNYNNNLLLISESNINSNTAKDLINNSTCFIFLGDSLSKLSLLNDSTTIAGEAFKSKIQAKNPVFFFGNSGKISGKNFIDNSDDYIYSAYYGEMTNNLGLNIFGDLIYQPLLLDNSDYYENRTCALLWGMMLNRKKIGIFNDAANLVKINSSTNKILKDGSFPLIVVDASNTTYVDSSSYKASSSRGTRQVVAMNNLRYSLTTFNELEYLIEQKKFDLVSEVSDEKELIPSQIHLEQNYPNPFNPTTKIRYTIPTSPQIPLLINERGRGEVVTLKVYDILGKEIATLVNKVQQPGNYEIEFNANAKANNYSPLPSGIYFYQLSIGENIQTKKMIYLK